MCTTNNNKVNHAIRMRAISVWLLLVGISCAPVHATEPAEAALRVAFVYNFIKFIEWPPKDTSQTIKLCAATMDTDARDALQQLHGKTANKRVIELVYLHPDGLTRTRLKDCSMLYLTQSVPGKGLPNPLPNGVVLVADEPHEQDNNVSIALLRNTDGRIEFAVNSSAVIHAGVNISSQLLKLAKKSRRRNG